MFNKKKINKKHGILSRTRASRTRRFLQGSALIFLLITALPAAALTPQEVFRRVERNVLVLEILNDKNDVISTHTALVLEKHRAVTRCDSVEGVAHLRVVQGNTRYDAEVAQRDIGRNLCTLNVPGLPGVAVAQPTTQMPEPGAVVYALSNALGLGISISQGVVAGIRKNHGETYIQFTAPVAPGSEGGGLYDESGRLVGIINYRELGGQNVNFAMPAYWLKEIESRAVNNATAPAWRGKTLMAIREKNWKAAAEFATNWNKALPDNVEAWIWLGYAESMQANWAAAEKAYREALQLEPAALIAATELAAVLLKQGKPQTSLDIAKTALSTRREHPQLWLALGWAERALGHNEPAKLAFEQAAQLDPWNVNAQLGLAELARERRDWADVARRYSMISRLDPQDEMAPLRLAEAYLFDNRHARALAVVDDMIARNSPRRGDALLWRGLALNELGRKREAIEALKAGLLANPLIPSIGWAWLGNIYYSVQLYAEAIPAYRESLRLDPKNVLVRGELGIALKDAGEYSQALALFEQLKTERPDDPLPWRQIAYTNSFLGRNETAIPAYERALSLDPKDSKVWRALLETYHQVGRRDDVKRVYEKLTTLDQAHAAQAYRQFILPFEVTQ